MLFLRFVPDGAAAPRPDWVDAGAPLRLVFTKPAHDAFALVRLPARAGAAYLAELRAWQGGNRRPVRMVWADEEQVYALVDCQGSEAGAEFVVYALPGDPPAQLPAEGAVDPAPIRFAMRRAYGQDSPADADQFRMMEARADKSVRIFAVESFDAANNNPEIRQGGDNNWERSANLMRLTTWLLAPAAGRWVFTIKGDHAAWLRVGETLAVEQTYARGRDQWQAGKPLALEKGLHRVTLDVVSMARRGGYRLAVAWRNLDAAAGAKTDLTPITGGALVEGRVERRDGDLHAFAQATPTGASYRFIGCPTVFLPVRLRSASVSWSGSSLACAWQDEQGRSLGAGPSIEAVLAGGGRRVAATLIVNDTAGRAATNSAMVAIERIPDVEYGLSSRLQGVPAFCYGDDPVLPELHLRATSPDAIAFDVAATITFVSGPPLQVGEKVRLTRSWGRMQLPPGRAEDFSAIRWRVSHGGETVQTGAWVFDATPFEGMPETVDGQSLRRGGDGVTLIARRASSGEVRRFPNLSEPEQRLLLLDGFLAPPESASGRAAGTALDRLLAHGLSGGRSVDYRRINLKALEACDEATGVARLMPLTQLRTLLPVDLVLLAPSLDGIQTGETLDVFERRLAALAGLIGGPGKSNLMLVVPPPLDILPGCGCVPDPDGKPCAHARDARALAECVMRVADAYGLPAVDLYTPFMTAASAEPLVSGGVLTPTGVNQAARTLLRAVYGREGGNIQ